MELEKLYEELNDRLSHIAAWAKEARIRTILASLTLDCGIKDNQMVEEKLDAYAQYISEHFKENCGDAIFLKHIATMMDSPDTPSNKQLECIRSLINDWLHGKQHP